MDASAFFVLGPDDEEVAVVVVQCNISDPAERPLADPAAASGDPRRARHHVPDRARAAAHAAAHVVGQAVAGGGARGLPAAARAGSERRARADADKSSHFEQGSLPAAIGPIGGASGRRPAPRFPLDRSIPRCADGSDRIHRRGVALAPDRRRMARARALSAAGRAHAGTVAGRRVAAGRSRRPGRARRAGGRDRCRHSLRRHGARRPAFRVRPGQRGRRRPRRPGGGELARGAAIPADVLAGRAHAGAVGLRRQQVARRMRGQGGAGDLRWTVLRPPAVFGPGDRELRPLFRCIARGFAPVPAGTRRALFAHLRRRSRDGGAALARGRHRLRPDIRAR